MQQQRPAMETSTDLQRWLRGRVHEVFTLQIPMTHGFGPVFPGRIPMMHYMAQDEGQYASGRREVLAGGLKFSDDVMFAYLQGTMHVDALAHAWYGDEVYGGKAATSTVGGHEHADVAAIGERGVVGRGVLLDVGRHSPGRLDRPLLQASPRPYGEDVDRRIVALLDRPPPAGFARWIAPLLAKALGDVSDQHIWRFLRAQRIDLARCA